MFKFTQKFVIDNQLWLSDRIATNIKKQIQATGGDTRQIVSKTPKVPFLLFYSIFHIHNQTQWDPDTKVVIHENQSKFTSIDKRDPDYYLPGGFMSDVIHHGYSWRTHVNGETIEPHKWHLTYMKLTGNLQITANIKWKTIDAQGFESLKGINDIETKNAKRPQMPNANNSD